MTCRLRDAAVRFSPMRTTVYLSKPIEFREPAQDTTGSEATLQSLTLLQEKFVDKNADDMLLFADEHELVESQGGRSHTESSSLKGHTVPVGNENTRLSSVSGTTSQMESKEPTADTHAKKFTEDGLPIFPMSSCTIPDPCVSTSGHAIASFYFYASFLLAVGYAVWNFVVFEEIVSVSMPLTASLGLNIPALLEVQCGAATNVTLLVNYSGSSSSASCFLWPNATSFFKDVNTVSTNYANSSVWFASAALSAGSVARFPAPWCYAFQQDVVMFNARWPTLAGIALAFDRIPWGSSCQITIRAAVSPPSGSPSSVSFTTTDSFQAVQTLSLEGGVVKTFFAAYTAVKIVQDKMRLSSATLDAYYFELDGVRSINNVEWGKPGADSSSVVSLRLTEVSRSIAKEDSRTVFTFLGFFGQVWGLVGKAMLVLGPLLVILCPRDFLADAKAGHVDGHTKFLLDDAWKPGTIAGFGLTLFQRVQALKKES